jgi:hypothetical protein
MLKKPKERDKDEVDGEQQETLHSEAQAWLSNI